MKQIPLLLALAAATGLLAGCGSGPAGTTNGSTSPGATTPGRAGSVKFTVRWPAPTRLIPVASNSVKFVVYDTATLVNQPLAGIVVSKPATSATLNNLPVGTLFVVATAYPQPGGQGVAQATATVPVQIVQGQTATVPITLVTTIDHIDITPANPSMVMGQTAQLTATPRDAAGNVVIVSPTNLKFLSDTPLIVSVDPTGPVVNIAANNVGTANISVVDTESGKTGSTTVTVLAHTFTTVGSLIVSSTKNSAVVLQGGLLNGFVLVTGGPFGQLFNPNTGAFISAGSTSSSRSAGTATLLSDGSALVTGGNSGSGTLNTAELFVASTTATTGAFTPLTSVMTSPRESQTATLLRNGKVLIAGGFNGGTSLASAELYDPGTQTFTATTPMQTARARHTATLLGDGTVLIAGGVNGGASLNSAEIFDPSLNGGAGGFRTTGSLLSPRQGHTATLLPTGSVLITGGLNGATALATAELYNPVAGTFGATVNTMSSARAFHTATLLNSGRVLVAGGSNGTTVLGSADVFDPTTGRFTPTPDALNVPRENHSAVLLGTGQVLLIGGDNGVSPLNSAEVTTSVL